jgi:hypothetical protein
MKRGLCFLAMIVFATMGCATVPVPTRTMATPTIVASAIVTPAFTPTLVPRVTETLSPSISVTEPATRTLTTTPTIAQTFTPVTYDRNPRAVLIEADVIPRNLSVPMDMHVPVFRLYGDGLVVLAGERALLASGLDASVRVGHLNESEIQSLVASLNQTNFLSLKDSYPARSAPIELPSASISVYLNKAKTVRVDALGYEGTPQLFSNLLAQITQTIPSDVQLFIPTDAYLETTDAGAASNLNANDKLNDWTIPTIRLADAIDGVTISGAMASQVAALVSRNLPSMLYREGDRAYLVRFSPNLPRAVHLTDWLGPYSDAPREFDGRTVEIVGYYRGWNTFGEATGSAPLTRNDWTIVDNSGAMYVTGAHPPGLNPSSRADVWSVVRLTAKVVYVRLGTSYLEAKSSQVLLRSAPMPTPTSTVTITPTLTSTTTRVATTSTLSSTTRTIVPTMTIASSISNADAAIAAVQARFPLVAKIQRVPANVIGASTSITVIDRSDGWDLVFREGSGDCMAGCINNRYYYFSVKKDASIKQAGEYSRIYNADKNNYETSGSPLWDVPKQ